MEKELIIAIFGSGLLSAFIVIVNDWLKLKYEDKKEEKKLLNNTRNEIRKELLKNIDFIYKTDYLSKEQLQTKKHNFLKTYRNLFLYASDEEVLKVNGMLETMMKLPEDDTKEMIKKKKSIGEGFLTLRKQTLEDTKLTYNEYKHLS